MLIAARFKSSGVGHMLNSSRALALATAALLAAVASPAGAEPLEQGFAVERFAPAPTGSGWMVLDDINLAGRLGAGISLTTSYARRPFSIQLPESGQRLSVVSHQAFTNVNLSVSYERFRISISLPSPIYTAGMSGVVQGHQFTAPAVDLGKYPDKISDARISVEARVSGSAGAPLRLGISASLWVPSGDRSLFETDGTWRGLARGLMAGDLGAFSYAGYLGLHARPLNEGQIAGVPRGSELVFGLGAGSHFGIDRASCLTGFVGPELFAATALRDLFEEDTTAAELLWTAQLRRTSSDGSRTVVKIGWGNGISSHFGAPDWRAIVAVEVSDRMN